MIQQMRKKKLSILLLLILIPLVSADIVSVNDAGDLELVIIPNQPIEGFFFGNQNISQNITPNEGGLSPYQFNPQTVCPIAITMDYKTITGLNALKQALYNKTGYLIDQKELDDILPLCQVKKVTPFYLYFILFIVFLSMLTYYNRKKFLIIYYHYFKKKEDDLKKFKQ